jgi:hypothetical protein
VLNVDVTYDGPGTNDGNICLGATVTAGTWTCNWDTTAGGLPDGSYDILLTVTDRAGNTVTDTRTVIVDNNPPAVIFSSWTPLSGAQYQYVSGNKLYFNPAQTGTVDLNIDAQDGGTGINRVDFPQLGANWTPAGPSSDNTAAGNIYSVSYGWSAGAADPGAQVATGYDNAGNSATAAFDVEADSTAPAGGTLTVPNVITSLATVNVAWRRWSWPLAIPDCASELAVKLTLTVVRLVMTLGTVRVPPAGAVESASTSKAAVAELPALSYPVATCAPGSAAPALHP